MHNDGKPQYINFPLHSDRLQAPALQAYVRVVQADLAHKATGQYCGQNKLPLLRIRGLGACGD